MSETKHAVESTEVFTQTLIDVLIKNKIIAETTNVGFVRVYWNGREYNIQINDNTELWGI